MLVVTHGQVPQLQYTDRIAVAPVVLQSQRPAIHQSQKTVEIPQAQHIDRIVYLPSACQRQVPIITTAQKTVEVPQIQSLDRVHDALVSKH